jgi:predicted DNA binding CopG/RHH family protein
MNQLNLKKKHFVSFRVSINELNRLTEKASKTGMTKSNYIRELLRNSDFIMETIDDELSRELSKTTIFQD